MDGTKYLRTGIGGNTCVHVDLVNGQVGFSVHEEGDTPARPPLADFWLTRDKLLKLHNITSQLVPQPEPPPTPRPVQESSSPFFQVNLDAILKHQSGFMKKPPWWFRWLYSAVVTKEKYRGDSY